MYEAHQDPYCYPGTLILINKLETRDEQKLEAFEQFMTASRGEEPLPRGSLDAIHYRAIHRHLFQDVYDWAGEIRTVRIGREGHWFCYPEYIAGQLDRLFAWLRTRDGLTGRARPDFVAGATHVLSELNAIHAFRDGNGRTQMAFMAELAQRAGHPLRMDRLERETFIPAMIASFRGDDGPLAARMDELTRP